MTARSRRWRTTAGILAGGFAAVLAFTAACSQSETAGSSDPGLAVNESDQKAGGDAGAPAAPGPAQEPTDGQTGTDPNRAPVKVEPQERSLIYMGTTTVRVEKVVEAADRAIDIAVGAGGLVGADRRTLDADRSEAHLVLRVPADKFAATLDELAKLGVEESRSVQTEDVTEAIVDLDARLTTQRASVARVRALLARANTIGEVVSIESELARREGELASLEQRRERLGDLVALSTITLNLRGPAAPEPKDEPDTGFVAGLTSGWNAFLDSVKVVLTVAGWLLPWLLAVGVPVYALMWALRRRRPVRPAVTVPAVATPTDNPPPPAP
jgi:hypothetical protein